VSPGQVHRAPGQPGGPDGPGGAPEPHPGRLRIAALALILGLVFGIGAMLAIAERSGCLRRGVGPQSVGQLPLPPAPDSAGDWLDTADSLLQVDPASDPGSQRRGFDMWARTLASLLPPGSDTMPDPGTMRVLMDSLSLPGEVLGAPGDAGMLAVVFRPRAAVRTRAPYVFYRLGGRVGFLPLGLPNAQRVCVAGWRADGELRLAAAGTLVTDQGLLPRVVAMSLKGGRGWIAWDTLPPPDSLAAVGATGAAPVEPAFLEQSGQPPLLVMRRPLPYGPFEECAGCPHRYQDRIWRVDGERLAWVAEQPEDTPYAALAGFLEALQRGGQDAAARFAWDPAVVEAAEALRLEAPLPDHSWRLQPGQQAGDTVLTALRLGSDAYRFHMQYDGSRWRVGSLERAGAARRP
jgi:hypothetical protein